VVGEIQKSYNAYAGILKREADAGYSAIEELRFGPIAMPKDREWISFIQRDSQFVDPEIPIRTADQIHYPGQDHFACQEIRAGLLERKSKYLKSYTAGWYVASIVTTDCADTVAGTCSRQLTSTNLSLRTKRARQSCLSTFQNRSSGLTRQGVDLRINSFSKDDKRGRCIVGILGYSGPRVTIP